MMNLNHNNNKNNKRKLGMSVSANTNKKKRKVNVGRSDAMMEHRKEMSVKEWLKNTVKLPQYFDLFAEQGFDEWDTIMDVGLTDNILEKIGINKMGHRLKIMKWFKELKN